MLIDIDWFREYWSRRVLLDWSREPPTPPPLTKKLSNSKGSLEFGLVFHHFQNVDNTITAENIDLKS